MNMMEEALMVGFIPKEGETESTIMSLEETMEQEEQELELAISNEEKLMMASYIPAPKRAVRRKATARHHRRDEATASHLHIQKECSVKVREFGNGTIRVMNTRFSRKKHSPIKGVKKPRCGINSYLKEYGLY